MNASTKILLVDDDERYAELIKWRMGKNCDIHSVHCMTDAIAWLKFNKVACILLDVGLPDTVGDLDSIEQIKKVRDRAAIVILSGNGDAEFIRNAIRSNVNGYLSKGRGDRTYMDISMEIDKAIENHALAASIRNDNGPTTQSNQT